MQNRRIITDYHNNNNNQLNNYSNYNNNNCYASSQMTSAVAPPQQQQQHPSPHSTIIYNNNRNNSDTLFTSSKWPPSSYPHQQQQSMPMQEPQKYPAYLSRPCSITTDSRVFPQNPGPSSMTPEQKYSPRERAARAAAIAAIWKNGLPKNTKFYTLKNQHILIFARHYFTSDYFDPMKANKFEYDQYYPNVMARYFPKAASLRLRLVKIRNETQESNEMTVLGFDKDIEAGILELKNILEAETKHFFKDIQQQQQQSIQIMQQQIPIQKRLSQFEAKVEEIPIQQYRNNSNNNLTTPTSTTPSTEFTSHQRQFDIKPESSPVPSTTLPSTLPSTIPLTRKPQPPNGIKTYHSFTILPKNRLSNINIRQRRYKSQDEANPEVIPITPQTPQRTTFNIGNNSPDVYIVDEKIAVRCPSAEVAATSVASSSSSSSFVPIQQQQQAYHQQQQQQKQQQQQQMLQQQQQQQQHRTPAPDPWQPYPILTSTPSHPPTTAPSSTPYIPQRATFIQPQPQQHLPISNYHHHYPQQPQQLHQPPQQQQPPQSYPDPDPYAFDFPASPPSNNAFLPQEWKVQSCEDLLNEIKSEAAMFEANTVPPGKVGTAVSRNSSTSNLDQNKPQAISRGTKRRESGRTFCNGAKAIVSYFSLDGTDSTVAKQQRRTASPFSELNATTVSAITAMP